MTPLKILIVEDEPIIAKDLSYMLSDLGYKISNISHSAKDALNSIQNNRPHLIMLDVNIEGNMDGIELAHKINAESKIPFIYLTSYSDKNTIDRAKQTQPLGYLTKPIDERDLITTIEIAMHNFYVKPQEQLPPHSQSESIFVKDTNHYVKLTISEILYAEANDNYTFIHTEKKKYLISNTLKVIERKLAPYNFKRIHRSYLINDEYVEKLEDGYVHLKSVALPFGKTFKKAYYANSNFL